MSKGLMCASGVIMCRMFLAIFPPNRSLNCDVFFTADLGAVLLRVADSDFHARLAFGFAPPSQVFCFVGIGRKGEAGGPPGALAYSARPQRLQSRGDPAHRHADKAVAALGRGKMIADDFLNSCNAGPECREVAFGGAGKDLHQRPPADLV